MPVHNYPPTIRGYKVCRRCDEPKHVSLFRHNNQVKDGLSSWCLSCHLKAQKQYSKQSGYKSNKPSVCYGKTHPEQYKAYQNRYHRNYNADPLKQCRHKMTDWITKGKKQGIIIPATKCQECDSDKHLCSYFEMNTVKKYMEHKPKKLSELNRYVRWLCRKCITGKWKSKN